MHLRMPPGTSQFIGMSETEFETKFAYAAPPPPVFAQAAQLFVPAQATALSPFADASPASDTPVAQPVAMAQPVAVAQPVPSLI
jgi:hypothetical protein